jgi:predicted HAD superfamily hydrolase
MIDFFFSSALSKTKLSTALFGYFMQILGMFEDLKCCIWCSVFVGIWYAHGKLIVKYFMVMYTLIM